MLHRVILLWTVLSTILGGSFFQWSQTTQRFTRHSGLKPYTQLRAGPIAAATWATGCEGISVPETFRFSFRWHEVAATHASRASQLSIIRKWVQAGLRYRTQGSMQSDILTQSARFLTVREKRKKTHNSRCILCLRCIPVNHSSERSTSNRKKGCFK